MVKTVVSSSSSPNRSNAPATLLIVMLLFISEGCATRTARKHMEGVAKGWSETVRASQVIPVYPMSEDVHVGDVYLVRSSIAKQHAEYRASGFLALQHRQVRLPYTNYSKVYFDGYWEDEYGSVPHKALTYTNQTQPASANSSVSNNSAPVFTLANAARVAFPTYSFAAQSGYGLSAAFPVEGIPVALSFLGTDQVNGSVIISDARTYSGDLEQLFSMLSAWAKDTNSLQHLKSAALSASPTPVYLRVVTRVYMAREIAMSLNKFRSRGGSGDVGTSSGIRLANEDGSFNTNYIGVLNALNANRAALDALTKVGASGQFVSIGDTSIGLKQSFDRQLVFGYIGFDVQVYENGDIGFPIPTFQHLASGIGEAARQGIYTRRYKKHLRELAKSDPSRARELMVRVSKKLDAREFIFFDDFIRTNWPDPSSNHVNPITEETVDLAIHAFTSAVYNYAASPYLFRRPTWNFMLWYTPHRVRQFNDAFEAACRVGPKER